jgi:3-O-acyltransferase
LPPSSIGSVDGSPAEASATRPQLPALAGLRFYAAMHIVLLHTFRAGWLPPEVGRLVRWGASSASLFFILSGFILTYAYAARGGGMRVPARQFWRRRLVRLVPPALVCHLLAVPLVWTTYGPVERWVRAAATATGVQAFWPAFASSFNSPAWALSYLALGYLLLPAVLRRTAGWDPRRLTVAMGVLWAAMLLPPAAYAALQPADPLWRTALFTFPLVRLPEFLFGVLLARLFCAREWPRLPAWAAPAAAALLVASLVLTPAVLFPLNHNGLFAPLHAVLLWALAVGTGGWMHRVLASRPSRRLGEASLGIYLLHVPLYGWMLHFFPDVAAWGPAPSAVFYAVFLGLTVVLGLGLERALERMIRGGRRTPIPIPIPVPALLPVEPAAPRVQPVAS